MNLAQSAKISAARDVLSTLDYDAGRSNERSALVLLALLDLAADRPWEYASDGKRMRIVEIMQWMRDHYNKDYAPNSRETIRRQTLHQFVDAGMVLHNPDNPERAVNSGHNCYQIAPAALALLRTVDESGFEERVAEYTKKLPSLRAQYAHARDLAQIPVTLPDGQVVTLTPGGQNVLIKEMVEQFCPRFTPGGTALYIGDAGRSDPVFDDKAFLRLGIVLDKHGKLPDLVVSLPKPNWLILMEAASTHGPVDAKRHAELTTLFAGATAGLVFVSCFPSRAEMREYLPDIAWETEAWCADHPDHLIHFNGERFLGPY